MKKNVKLISLLLALLMLAAPLVACTSGGGGEESSESQSVTESESTEKQDPESDGTESTNDGKEDESESDSSALPPVEAIENAYTDYIKYANGLKNGVNPYYTDATRAEVTVDNQVMSLGYGMVGMSGKMQLSHLSNTQGTPYITDTMDVVLNMENGKSYCGSRSLDSSILNIYRYGYYYYETRIEGQTFMNDIIAEKELVYPLDSFSTTVDISAARVKDGILYYNLKSGDPQIRFNAQSFTASDYNYLEFTMRVNYSAECTVYLTTDQKSFQPYDFTSKAGEDFVTYLIPLDSFESYSGTVLGLRFDINGPAYDTKVEFSSIRVIKANYDGAPETLTMQRSFHTYSNKLHHLVQLSTTETVSGVKSVQIVTKLDESRVASLIVKDAGGLKETLDGVDWATAEYVAFDVKDAGIFGYILPAYAGGGSLEVTLKDGVYTIIHTKIPEGGNLTPSALKTENADDFYMGHRIYNDETHSFDSFLHEAEIERHPLTSENITVDEGYDDSAFAGYDPLRGSYVFTLSGGSFNKCYYVYPNRQYRVNFTVNGDDKNRDMFFMTHMMNNGGLECAALLGNGDLLLPIPIEVCKNFNGDGENTIFNLDDRQYSETYFPMSLKAGEEREYTIVHAYQNWGIFPLKQISSIQYYTPFYHLSTGVTETNCIVPFSEAGPTLPDHRAMSAPFWPTQPQHTSGGGHVFLHFVNEEGKTVISNTTYATIDSYGPTYADINLGFISADNRIKAEYTHMEMPQTDENRTYYELSYTFLEDVSFTDFADQFKFYRCTDNNSTGWYKRIGYLDENNESRVVDSQHEDNTKVRYILGDNCPYFSFFDMEDTAPDSGTAYGYVNVSFMIKDYEVILGGEKITPRFVITNYGDFIQLSLDLGEVTFKQGDTISINAIIMPWGSQLLDDGIVDEAAGNFEYDMVVDEATGELYMDKNVRDVRANSLLDPFKAEPMDNCTLLESTFLPKLKTTDGKSASFTLSGGSNNVTVRVYGFEKLTAPSFEEYIDGRWRPYKISSASNRDDKGYGYFYDGYMVHYDSDGTYSYSFVVNMDGGEPRSFRIKATEDFGKWPDVDHTASDSGITTENDPLNVYVDANELYSFVEDTLGYFSTLELLDDADGSKFVRYFANSGAREGIITPFKADHDAYVNLESTGQYAVFKYRLASDSPFTLKNFQFFASTVNDAPKDNTESCAYYDIKYDDQWHVIILDLSTLIHSSRFSAKEDGSYMAKYFRMDIFNMSGLTEDMYIDLAYVGLSDNLDDIFELNSEMDMVTLVTNMGSDKIDPSTKTVYNDTPLNVHIPAEKIASASANLALNSVKLSEDGTYVRLAASVGSKYEAFATLYSNTNPLYANLDSTGQYVVFKYRLQSDTSVRLSALEIFTSTESEKPQGPDNTDYYMLDYDGEWHVVVMDMSKLLPEYCIADGESDKYKLQFLRFDFFSANIPDNIYIDFAYIGISDDLADICRYNSDMEEILLVSSTDKETAIDPATGKPISNNKTPLNVYVDGATINKQITAQKVGPLFSSLELANDGSYLRMYANSEAAEAYVKVFNAADDEYAELESTGKYLVFKYRMAAIEGVSNTLQIYTATEIEGYANDGRANYYSLEFDNEWHVVVIDATTMIPHAYFPPQEDGVYKANYMRFDFFNGNGLSNELYMDIAYVGICDELSKIYEFNSDMSEIILVEGPDKETAIDPKTGEAIN